MKIITDNKQREIIYDETFKIKYFKYKNKVYCLEQFIKIKDQDTLCKNWDSIYPSSILSNVIIKISDTEKLVKVGTVLL